MTTAGDWTKLTEIIALAEAAGPVIGVSVVSPGGERFSHHGGRRFVAASTVKIAIMIELFRQIEAGEQSPGAEHILRPEDKADGSGILANLHDGLALTLADLASLMMSISDNTATNILIDRVGIGQVNEAMHDLGIRNSTLG